MSHAKILLGAVGNEDGYLSLNSKNTFFKSTYKTHTNFSTNWLTIPNNNKPQPSESSTKFPPKSTLYFRIPLQGDIILDNYLRFKLYDDEANDSQNKDFTLNNVNPKKGIGEFTALSLINKIELLYNDKIIDVIDKNYLASFMKISQTSENFLKYRKFSSFDNNSTIYDKYMPTGGKYIRYVSLPIPFWYTKSEGLGFPMWALNDPNIGIKITLSILPHQLTFK